MRMSAFTSQEGDKIAVVDMAIDIIAIAAELSIIGYVLLFMLRLVCENV